MSPEVSRLLEGCATVSAKIRALDAAGYSRADIARLLGKRYQHVRNVLEGDRIARSGAEDATAGLAEAGRAYQPPPLRGQAVEDRGGAFRLAVAADGSVALPEAARRALKLKPGSIVIAELKDDRLVLLSGAAATRRVREMVQSLNLSPERLLSEELLAERRQEAEQD